MRRMNNTNPISSNYVHTTGLFYMRDGYPPPMGAVEPPPKTEEELKQEFIKRTLLYSGIALGSAFGVAWLMSKV